MSRRIAVAYSRGVLSRKKNDESLAPQADPVLDVTVDSGTGKGRPTPKRRDQQAAHRRPLVDDGKSASAAQKQQRREQRAKGREAMLRGEERYLPERDRGAMRRFLRDSVDARWNIGEILLPAMLVILALMFLRNPLTQLLVFVLAYGLIIAGVVDGVVLWRRTKRRATEAFGEEPGKGSAMYVVMRAFQMRRTRVPRPAVERGAQVVPRR